LAEIHKIENFIYLPTCQNVCVVLSWEFGIFFCWLFSGGWGWGVFLLVCVMWLRGLFLFFYF